MNFIVMFLVLLNFILCYSLNPVFLFHGVFSDNGTLSTIIERLKMKDRNVVIINPNRFIDWDSLISIPIQVFELRKEILKVKKKHNKPINVIGYSQGGLICRALIEYFPELNVRNFISLSSPQAGQYGANLLRIIFPNLLKENIYELFYTNFGQEISVANYWNDPNHQDLYYKYNLFLTSLNNEMPTGFNEHFKNNVLKLNNFVLIGGPDDGVIEPWQSSQFGYYDKDGRVISLQERDFFKNDNIGLKQLYLENKLKIFTIANISHKQWHTNIDVIENNILPFLD